MLPKPDTIAAIATAQGRGGIGVVRVSGSKAPEIARSLLGQIPAPRHAKYCIFPDEVGKPIDQGVAIYFVAPNSYTGEHVLELQGHGGVAVLNLLLQRCLALGARLADPGEFTKRAYLNSKIDLLQAEGVIDLIEATTSEAARCAMRSLHGEFSLAIHQLVEKIVTLRMLIEAMLDFPEEEIDSVDVMRRDALLTHIRDSLNKTLETSNQGKLLREGARIALIGQPNVGKSSLLNRLSGDEVALVSDVPGTTRDVIRQEIEIGGVPLHIMDTAGLRESQDEIENMGMARTHDTVKRADLVLLLIEASKGMDAADEKILATLPAETPRLIIRNKIDLNHKLQTDNRYKFLNVSAKTGAGIEELRAKILFLIGRRDQEGGEFMARERHVFALKNTKNHLVNASAVLNQPELLAEELRLAQAELSKITGEFSADDLLGEIFSRFCIGK